MGYQTKWGKRRNSVIMDLIADAENGTIPDLAYTEQSIHNGSYSLYARDKLVKGILIPSPKNGFRERADEEAYLKYTHGQRQISLYIVNIIDIILKVILIIAHAPVMDSTAFFVIPFLVANLGLCVLMFRGCFVDRNLHWAAGFTWLILNVEGIFAVVFGYANRESMVWFIVFIIFVPYFILPMSLKWCIIDGVISATLRTIIMIGMRYNSFCIAKQLSANSMLYIAINFTGIYIKYLTDRAQRMAFMETQKALENKQASEIEYHKIEKLLNSILPEFVHQDIRNEMSKFVNANFKKLFIYQVENVSILFADIQGFTQFSSEISAQLLVKLLNALFARFDKIAEENHCLRIKLLGDCYYCISTFDPISWKTRPDHAEGSVETGLHMIKTITETSAVGDLNIRVGIHTGSVMCGIIGANKWQFDVWSNDVNIANHLEKSGIPGRVHISEATLKCLKPIYDVEPGYGHRRDNYLKIMDIRTYLISQTTPFKPLRFYSTISLFESVPFRNPSIVLSKLPHASMEDDSNCRNADNLPEWTPEIPFENLHGESVSTKDINLSRPPTDEQVTQNNDQNIPINFNKEMRQNNLNPFTLKFRDTSQEKKFRQLHEDTFRSNMLCIYVICIVIVVCQAITIPLSIAIIIILLTVTIILLTIGFIFVMAEEFPCFPMSLKRTSAALVQNHFRRSAFYCSIIIIMSVFSSISLFYLPSAESSEWLVADVIIKDLPNEIINLNVMVNSTTSSVNNSENRKDLNGDHFEMISRNDDLATVVMWKQCNHPEYIVFSWVLCLVALAAGLKLYFLVKISIAAIMVICYSTIILYGFQSTFNQIANPRQLILGITFSHQLVILLIVFFVMVAYHAALVEITLRLDFMWREQSDKELSNVKTNRHLNEVLIKNILPDHVASYYLSEGHSNELYAKTHSMCGVMFASITNFEDFYTTDIENAKEVISLLNEIIFLFDLLLEEQNFESVEKIKTIGSTYMAASGLNAKRQAEKGYTEEDSICHLVEFAFMLQSINQLSLNSFHLRIGICSGSLVSGVIGARKPVYDIWGDTVNVASRMDSTGENWKIQVPHYTAELLMNKGYLCIPRGIINVKGKGAMETYWVLGKQNLGSPSTLSMRSQPLSPNKSQESSLAAVFGMLQKSKR